MFLPTARFILRCAISRKGSSLLFSFFLGFFFGLSPLLVVGYCREIKCCDLNRVKVKKRKKREMSEAGGFYPATSKLGLGSEKYATLHNVTDAFPIKNHKMTGRPKFCHVRPFSSKHLKHFSDRQNKEN